MCRVSKRFFLRHSIQCTFSKNLLLQWDRNDSDVLSSFILSGSCDGSPRPFSYGSGERSPDLYVFPGRESLIFVYGYDIVISCLVDFFCRAFIECVFAKMRRKLGCKRFISGRPITRSGGQNRNGKKILQKWKPSASTPCAWENLPGAGMSRRRATTISPPCFVRWTVRKSTT